MGKILGQGGENVKRLQEMAGCRIAVLGRGSMKDKNKVRRTSNSGYVQNQTPDQSREFNLLKFVQNQIRVKLLASPHRI